MAITINWGTRVIAVPQADLTALGGGLFELDLDWFRLQLKDLEDSEAGMTFPVTHRHNTEVTLGSIVLARVIEIINGYTVTFEDGQYAVNLVGANSNVATVTNVNQVSVRSFNSAGLIGDIGKLVRQSLGLDGFTLSEELRILTAVAAGQNQGTKAHPEFEALDGSQIVVEGDADSDGRRTNVVLTP